MRIGQPQTHNEVKHIEVTHTAEDLGALTEHLEGTYKAEHDTISKAHGGEYKTENQEYTIFAHLKSKEGEKAEEGKKVDPLKGTSRTSFEIAMKNAVKEHPEAEFARLEGTITGEVKLPYHLELLAGAGRAKRSAARMVAKDEKDLRKEYGGRVAEKPEDVNYEVEHFSGSWTGRKGEDDKPRGTLVGRGFSKTSLKEAIDKAKTARGKKKSQGSLYTQTASFRVYDPIGESRPLVADARAALSGAKEKGGLAAAAASAARVAVPSIDQTRRAASSGSGRSGTGAAYTPSSPKLEAAAAYF